MSYVDAQLTEIQWARIREAVMALPDQPFYELDQVQAAYNKLYPRKPPKLTPMVVNIGLQQWRHTLMS